MATLVSFILGSFVAFVMIGVFDAPPWTAFVAAVLVGAVVGLVAAS